MNEMITHQMLKLEMSKRNTHIDYSRYRIGYLSTEEVMFMFLDVTRA